MKLGSQMLDLDKLASTVLAKSMSADKDKEDTSTEVNPEDVSANIPDEDNEKPEETTTEEKEKREDTIKKSVDTEDSTETKTEDETDEETEKNSEDEQATEEEMEKSFKSNEVIQESIEASEFLETLVETIIKSLAGMQIDLQKSQSNSNGALEILAKSLGANLRQGEAIQSQLDTGIQNLQKSISEQITTMKSEILSELTEFSHQPASLRKSVGNVAVHDRDFQKSLGTTSGVENLSKSEVLSILNTELYSGNALVTPSDIISYESGAPLRPEIEKLVEKVGCK